MIASRHAADRGIPGPLGSRRRSRSIRSSSRTPISEPPQRLERGELVRDPTRAVYRYHQVFPAGNAHARPQVVVRRGRGSRRGPRARSGRTRRPIRTRATRAIAGITAAGASTPTPVLAGYRDAAGEVDRLFRKSESERAARSRSRPPTAPMHQLWRVQSAEVIGKLRPLFAPKKLHVLDGHARYEAHARVSRRSSPRRRRSRCTRRRTTASCAWSTSTIRRSRAGARHRIVRGTGAKRDDVLAEAKPYFIVEKLAGAAKDLGKQFAALADTVAHQPAFVARVRRATPTRTSSRCRPTSARSPRASRSIARSRSTIRSSSTRCSSRRSRPARTIETVLDPNAAIALGERRRARDRVRPLSIDQITHVDEVGELLPFGSTAFHPPVAHLVAYHGRPRRRSSSLNRRSSTGLSA